MILLLSLIFGAEVMIAFMLDQLDSTLIKILEEIRKLNNK